MDDKFIDVTEYTDNKRNLEFKEGVFYYTSGQVAEILGITKSKLSYYTELFNDILNIEVSNTHKRYTKNNIEELENILELKKQGMQLKQILKYKMETRLIDDKAIIPETPIAVDVLAQALLKEQDNKLNEFEHKLFKKLEDYLDKNKLDTLFAVEESLSDFHKDLKSYIDQRELEYKQQDEERISMLKAHMEDTKKKNEEENSKKSIWSRIFNK